jgi:TATA-binding protein-associated factor Taf7
MAAQKGRKQNRKARRWLVGDAWVAVHDTTNGKARVDIAKRYPLFATATEAEIFQALNRLDYLSARKVEDKLREIRGLQPEKPAKVKVTEADVEADEDEDEDEGDEGEDDEDEGDEPEASATPTVEDILNVEDTPAPTKPAPAPRGRRVAGPGVAGAAAAALGK